MKIILLGPPGSGKGTVSERLEKDCGFFHLSAGELLREEVAKKTTIGKEIQSYINKGELAPSKFVVELVKLEVRKKDNYILDGFPRSLEQAKQIEGLKVDAVVLMDVSEEVVIERFAGRRICEKSGHGYHIKYLPPKKAGICDVDGSKLVQRADDKPEVIKKRFVVYHKETQPLINYYEKKKLLHRVDASKKPEDVYNEVKKALKLKNKKR